jgi:4'-phosphopantetheinyl transferase
MPLEKIVLETERAWALWRITEDEDTLSAQLETIESPPSTITNMGKRLEWIAGRLLVKEVSKRMELPFQGIVKDEYGKPYPSGYPYHLSLSHSFPYVATIFDKRGPVGIDLEQPKDKLLRVAHRIHSVTELQDAGTDIVKHCVYWCAKETLIKIHGKKDLVFAENMHIEPFELREEGDIRGRIIVPEGVTIIPLRYMVFGSFVIVFNLHS